MAKKKFDIETYSKAKILSPRKYRIWYKQIQENGNNEQEMQQLTDRLKTDIEGSKATRKKLFSKWWLKELISAGAIVGLAFLVNFFTPFSPFTFLLLGIAMLTAVNIVTFGVVPGIRFLNNKYKSLLAFRNELQNQEQLSKAESKVVAKLSAKEKEQTKNFIDKQILSEEKTFVPEQTAVKNDEKTKNVMDGLTDAIRSNKTYAFNAQFDWPQVRKDVIDEAETTFVDNGNKEENANNSQQTEVEVITPMVVEEPVPLARKELHVEGTSKPRYIFRVKTRTMTADGNCPNEDVFVNISTTDLDKFIEELSKKNFKEKGLKASRSQKAKKANAMVLTVENARELIDTKLQNGEITPKQAEKLKKQITEVVLVLEISSIENPTKKTYETREYALEQKDDFFDIVEKVKSNVLKRAKEQKAKMEEDNEMTY